MIPESQWFFFGTACKRNITQTHSQLALYNPIIDRFVVVFDDEDLLRRTSVCWSNRCQLILCELGQADNFAPELIDNSCCMNWTLSDTHGLRWTRFPDQNQAAYQVQHLLPQTVPLDCNDLILQNLEYIWASITWLWIEKNQITPKHKIVPDRMHDCLNFPWPLPINHDLARDIQRVIYTEWDFELACTQIQRIFSSYEHCDFTKINLRINGSTRRT